VTGWIEREANRLLEAGLADVPRVSFDDAAVTGRDFVSAYVDDLAAVIDLDAIREPASGSASTRWAAPAWPYWQTIRDRHGLDSRSTTRRSTRRSDFRCRSTGTADPDGLLLPRTRRRGLRDHGRRLRRGVRNDPGRRPPRDRHAGRAGLLNPNHPPRGLHRLPVRRQPPDWGPRGRHGKTLVSSSIIDGSPPISGAGLVEVPVGFKWFVDGLLDGSLGLRRRGERRRLVPAPRRDVWSTDKDGLIPCLLAAEMKATTGKDPGELYAELAERFGRAAYKRTDVAASAEQKDVLKRLSPEQVRSDELAGEPITSVLTEAPGNGAAIGGSRSWRSTAGSRRARRAPRTSTRSTPRAWTARSAWSASSARRGRSSPTRWTADGGRSERVRDRARRAARASGSRR
jgi:phosphoglucomutase